ncbi:hypothetical protein GPECTOR_26g464 [Gonium pectorale]|uniref:RBR-type E3 ubiquitin transferase n=1 Tax=Gonium pectorale TaxID=33097 RepID=A0A150GFC8_GONPE|nr:hypothetical protein GPECTOR_26g464 [Gonium pectorale]|eukprot:KXZ48561.1 hypothetical protein GPECTOR_26g464 [Gonium pectorale]
MELSSASGVDDVDFVQLVQVDSQLAEVRNKQGQLTAAQLSAQQAAQAQAARESRTVAEVLDEHERRNARIAQHDAAFARRLANVDRRTWQRIGDEIEEPINLPPPRPLPKVDEAAALGGAPALGSAPAPGATAPAGLAAAGAAAGGIGHTQTTCPPSRMATRAQSRSAGACASPCGGARSSGAPAGAGSGAPAAPASSSGRTGCRQHDPAPAAKAQRTGAASTAGAVARSASAGAGAGSGPSSSAGKRGPKPSAAAAAAAAAPEGPTIECVCCFDQFPLDQVSCAGSDAPSSSTAAAGCGHYFCAACMTQYVLGAVKDRKFPVMCPMASGCKVALSTDAVMEALRRHPKEQQAFGLLQAEQAIPPRLRTYCPHKNCSVPLQRPEEGDIPAEGPTSCPACNRMFCLRCLIPGWHHGYTCADFQKLPAHLRSAEDAAMLQYSARQQWKQCPHCKQMVERSEGCNHMKCRCGREFCYACGAEYVSKAPTPDNVHGTPGCACPLFDVPPDEEPEEQAANPQGRRRRNRRNRNRGGARYDPPPDQAAEGAQAWQPPAGYVYVQPAPWAGYAPVLPAAYGQPAQPYGEQYYPYGGGAPDQEQGDNGLWRGGREVIRRRCRNSASIYDCPWGQKCWYWHDEDDDMR